MAEPSADDRRHMAHAIMLARRGLGTTADNPAVGCVIVDRQGNVAGLGWTAPGGRPHAEIVALAQAGGAAQGGTAYVTLEPCNHHGRSPPCTLALLTAGVKRVVVAALDPHPSARGGADALRTRGVAVEAGVLAAEAEQVLAGFLTRLVKNRPQVILKLAVSADGSIAARSGVRTQITGPRASDRVHLMRAEADAVMVGANTVIVDDPLLTCRLPGMEDRSPPRLVVDSALRTPVSSKLVRSAKQVPLRVFHGQHASPNAVAALSAAGVRLDAIAAERGEDGIDLDAVFAILGTEGCNTVLVEGGAALAASLLARDLVDGIALFRSPKPLGEEGVPALAQGSLAETVAPTGRFELTGEELLGDDVLRQYRRKP
ncbi:MAG: bifunctional diaminohydroxyphosphoribosylaminopyrimidine deaminase/5-amino-6-(5-phosphoribosylamino)uracil reductase RibD [Hyphomicrobiales bacterium]